METSYLEKPQAFAVLHMIAENPGLTYSALAGGRFHDKTKGTRLVELTEAGIVEGRPDVWKGRPCTRYYLTQRGNMLMVAIDLIEKL